MAFSSMPPQGLVHGILMTIAWVGCQNIAIWALLLRNKFRFAIYIHGLAMGCLLFLTALSAGIIITYKGIQVITKNYYHTILGLVICCLAPAIMVLGVVAKFMETSSSADPKKLDIIKFIHTILGWVLIASSRIALYDEWITKLPELCLPLIFADLASHFCYIYKKVFQPRMESVSINKLALRTTYIKQISKIKQLQHFEGDYFIFADYVYRLSPLYNTHPGGLALINKIKARQVDRFIYGMQRIETLESSFRVSHTANSIKLVGQPLAMIQPSTIYPKMDQLNAAKISAINFYQSSKRIYTLYLKPTNNVTHPFVYRGYSDISELGKYFAVTICNKKTRLYTMVNFLQRKSVRLVEEVSKGNVFDDHEKQSLEKHSMSFSKQDYYKSIHQWTDFDEQDKMQNEAMSFQQGNQSLITINQDMEEKADTQKSSNSSIGKKIKKNHIPLLIKKYDDGQFTSAFLRQNFPCNILISKPRGRGLALQDILESPKPYKIYMFSGGTGIYPFADTIDLLFKSLLIQQKSIFSNAIIKSDPILQSNQFSDFQFQLYISVVTVQQIHPITLFQCEYLASHNKLNVHIKSQSMTDYQIIAKRYPNISVGNLRFQNVIWQLNQHQVTRIYACGPTRMTNAILTQLERAYWSPRKYLIL